MIAQVSHSRVRSAMLTAASICFLLTPVVKLPLAGGMPLHLDSLAYVYAILLFLMKSLGENKLEIPRFAAIAVAICLATTIYTLSIGILYEFVDFNVLSYYLRPAITFMAAVIIGREYVDLHPKRSLETFLKIVLVVFLIQGLVFVLTYISPDFRDSMSTVFARNDNEYLTHLISLRAPGFVASGGDGLSLNHSLLSLGALVYLTQFVSGRSKYLVCMCIIFASLLSGLLTGRSGLFVVLTIGLIYIVTKSTVRQKFTFIGFVLISAIGLSLYSASEHAVDESEYIATFGYEDPIARVLKMSRNYKQGARVLPSVFHEDFTFSDSFLADVPTLFFGTGGFGRGDDPDYIRADIGYLRMMKASGVILMLVFSLVFFIPYYTVLVLAKISRVKEEIALRSLITFTLMFGLVANVKIIYTSTRVFIFFYIVLISLYFYRRKTEWQT